MPYHPNSTTNTADGNGKGFFMYVYTNNLPGSNVQFQVRHPSNFSPLSCSANLKKKKKKKNTTDKRWEKIRKTILFSRGSRIVVIKSTVSSQVFFFFVFPANRGKGKKGYLVSA